MGSPDESKAKRRRWLRRIVAWGVTIGVIAFLLTQYSAAAIGEALARGNWLAMIPIVVGSSLWALLWMTTADWLLFSRALGRLRWFDALRGKGGSSVLQAVNHTIGQGAYGVWLARLTRSGLSETIGAITYIALTDLIALFAIVSAAVWFTDPAVLPRAELLRLLAPLILVGLIASAFVAPRLLPRLLPRAKVLSPWLRIEPLTFLLIVITRLVAVTGVMVGTWTAARVFGLDFPLSSFLVYLPIIFLAGALPINVLGFGAVQLVWVAAFEPWASGPEILAFQFLSHGMALGAFILRGAPFLPSVLRDIAPDKDLSEGHDAGEEE